MGECYFTGGACRAELVWFHPPQRRQQGEGTAHVVRVVPSPAPPGCWRWVGLHVTLEKQPQCTPKPKIRNEMNRLCVCSRGSGTGGCRRQAASLEHWSPESLLLPDEAQPCDGEAWGQTLVAQRSQKERWVVESSEPCLRCHSHDMVPSQWQVTIWGCRSPVCTLSCLHSE